MNRRAFLTMLAGLPVFAAMPVVALEACRAPRTAAELAAEIEGLYAHIEEPSVRAFEEFVVLGGQGDAFAYRAIHGQWMKRGRSESELVSDAWRDVIAGAEGYEDGTLIWRKKPICKMDRAFDAEDKRGDFVLRFRFSVLPSDWQQRAKRAVEIDALPGWRGSFASCQGRIA